MPIRPIPKLILITAVVGGVVYGVNTWRNSQQPVAEVTGSSAPASQPSSVKTFINNTVSGTNASEPLGSKKNPLRVSIVSFHGYAPGLLANGGLKTGAGSINDRNGLAVEFLLQDDIPTLHTLFSSNGAHCAWRTSDFWAQEHPNLRNAKADGKAVMVVDNTYGADAVIAHDPAIKSIEDLAGKSVALLQFTPSHGLLQDAIENSSLTPRQKQSIKMVFINADEGTGGVRAAYESRKVDAAVIWDPDLALALRAGGHVVYSTKQASNLIYDVVVCNTQVLNQPASADAVQKFVAGWMEGVVVARANHDAALNVLVKSEDLFRSLVQQEGAGFVKGLFGNIKWTGLEDNIRILGMSTEPNHYERVYKQFDQIYRTAGALANPTSPVINPSDSFDYRFINNLAASAPAMVTSAAAPTVTFSQAGLTKATAKPAAVTKPVMVTFASGSAELSQRAKKQIDLEMVPFIENNGTAYIEISGNSDSVGSDTINLPLSKARANAVMNYLVTQWAFPRTRFNAVGLGSTRPICNEQSGEMPIEQCRELNRSTRVAVLSR